MSIIAKEIIGALLAALMGGGGNVTIFLTVNGPVVTSQSLTATFGTAQMDPVNGGLVFGNTTSPGVSFTANPKLPTGVGVNNLLQFVQLVTTDTRNQLPYGDIKHSYSNPQVCSPGATGLDNYYPLPYVSRSTSADSPRVATPANLAEILRDFAASMYLMWDPALPTGCAPARTFSPDGINITQAPTGCASIPVPLASMRWEFKACAIDTLIPSAGLGLNGQPNGTAWSVSCGQPNPNLNSSGTSATVLVPSSSNNYAYPQWSTWFTNRGAYNCQ